MLFNAIYKRRPIDDRYFYILSAHGKRARGGKTEDRNLTLDEGEVKGAKGKSTR